jgi:hypothetical protein
MKIAITRYTLIPLLLVLAACASNYTLEQRADSLYGSFVIAKEQAVKITRDPVVSNAVKRCLATTALAADPLAADIYGLLNQLDVVKKGIAAGTATQEDLDLLNAKLAQLVLNGRGPIDAFTNAVDGAC